MLRWCLASICIIAGLCCATAARAIPPFGPMISQFCPDNVRPGQVFRNTNCSGAQAGIFCHVFPPSTFLDMPYSLTHAVSRIDCAQRVLTTQPPLPGSCPAGHVSGERFASTNCDGLPINTALNARCQRLPPMTPGGFRSILVCRS